MKLGVVLLAAGRSSRFRENKPAGCPQRVRQTAVHPASRPDRTGTLQSDFQNKLLADFGGRPMVCCALDAANGISADRVAIVTGNETIAQLARARGCHVIANCAPELGQAHSIRLGVSAMQEMDAVLLMVCDQPLLSRGSLMLLVESFACSEKGVACLRDQNHMGNPAVFAAKYYPELLALQGDRGAKGILRAHEDDLLVVAALGENELSDADTPQMLEEMRMQ